MMGQRVNRLGRLYLRLRGREEGVSAVEFSLIAPVFLLVLAFTVDFSGMVFARMSLNESVAAGANFAMINAQKVSDAEGQELADDIVQLLAAGTGNTDAIQALVSINNGPVASIGFIEIPGDNFEGGRPSGGSADVCYCPTGQASTIEWGQARQCGTRCPGGGIAGKFVQIDIRRAYSPLMAGLGIAEHGQIPVSTLVQVQ